VGKPFAAPSNVKKIRIEDKKGYIEYQKGKIKVFLY
jgi:hypothetical protein